MKQWIFALIAAVLLVCTGCASGENEAVQPEMVGAVETTETGAIEEAESAETQAAETEPSSDEASREIRGASGGMGGASEEVACPGMNASVAVWEAMGVLVVQDDTMWDSTAPAEQLNAQVEAMATQPGDIHYTVFSGGNHMGTWRFAYDIEAIRDWLFAQSK